jgi:hypothetical protein
MSLIKMLRLATRMTMPSVKTMKIAVMTGRTSHITWKYPSMAKYIRNRRKPRPFNKKLTSIDATGTTSSGNATLVMRLALLRNIPVLAETDSLNVIQGKSPAIKNRMKLSVPVSIGLRRTLNTTEKRKMNIRRFASGVRTLHRIPPNDPAYLALISWLAKPQNRVLCVNGARNHFKIISVRESLLFYAGKWQLDDK